MTLGSPSQLQSDQIGLDSHYLPGLVGDGCESGEFLTFQCTDRRTSGLRWLLFSWVGGRVGLGGSVAGGVGWARV